MSSIAAAGDTCKVGARGVGGGCDDLIMLLDISLIAKTKIYMQTYVHIYIYIYSHVLIFGHKLDRAASQFAERPCCWIHIVVASGEITEICVHTLTRVQAYSHMYVCVYVFVGISDRHLR